MDGEKNDLPDKGKMKVQKENVYNKYLPYADELEEESSKLFSDIKSNLIKSVLAREMRPGCALWSSRLNKYIKIYGMNFSKEDHIALIKLFYELVIIPDLEPTRITKCAATLMQLLKKKNLLTRDELQLEWRPLYDMCVNVMEKSKTDIGMYRYSSTFESILNHLVRAARVYFPASATQEILDEFRPNLCPFDSGDITRTVKQLELFLPCYVKPEEAGISYNLWFEELMTLWDVCHDACQWEHHMMWLMAELGRFQLGRVDWQPYIPIMFVRFQRTFQLPVTFKQKQMQMGKHHKIDVPAMAIWIVSILNGNEGNIAFFHFEKFMQSLESFFYPANMGRWTPRLRELLRQLSFNFVQRVHCERFKAPSWDFQVPDSYKLTDDDIDRFVNIMKPCIEQAVFSRIGSQDTTLALQYLASLRPNIIIPMTLEKLYSSMSSLTEPHKLTSSMMAVIATGRYMAQGFRNGYSEGPTNIIPLLMELLPGIDPNDLRKSYVTFNFIVHFVNMIPIIDSSEAFSYHELTEEEHVVCEASAGFEDFVMQFFDRICLWMESSSLDFIRLEQMTNNDNMKNRTETISESVLGSLIGAVLMQCSPQIFTSALRKLFNFVISKVMEVRVSGKMLAICCHYFTRVNPKETLKLFVPYLCDRIEELLAENPNIEKDEHIDDALMYNLLILSEVVDGRSELIQYMDRLTLILDKTLHMSCLAASQLAARMLELMMSSLTNILPTEARSSQTDYSTPIKDFLSIREWGLASEIKDLKLSWYVPGEEEVKAVQHLLDKYLVPELYRLNQHAEGRCALSRQEIKQTLKIIISILSCQPLLPIWEEPPFQLVDSVLEPWAFNLKVCCNHVVTMADGRNVRKVIVDVMHRLQEKLLRDDEGDTKSLQNIIRIYNIILFNKTRGQDFEIHWKSFHMTKKLLEDRLHKKKLHLRSVLIDRVVLQQAFRIESRNCSFTNTHRQILSDLFTLSVSRYSEVRRLAQCKVFAVTSSFPYSFTVLTDKIKEILKLDSQKYHEKFKGCLYLLMGSKNAPIIAKHDWLFIREIWPLIVKSMPSEKPSIINLVSSITDAVEKFFPTIAIKLMIPESALTAAYELGRNDPVCDLSDFQVAIGNGEKYLKEKSDERRVAYDETVDALLEALQTGNLHWRYNYMALHFLKNLVHFDVNYNSQVVKYFLHASINESIRVRKIAMKVLVFVMVQNKPKFKKIEIDPSKYAGMEICKDKIRPGVRDDNKWLLYNSKTLPRSAEEWNATRFVHKQSVGYYSWPKKLEVHDAPSRQVTPAKRMDKLTDTEQEIYNFFSDENNVSTLIKYLAMEEKKGHDKFNVYRFFTLKNLFKMFEDELLPLFIPHIQTLVQDKLESHQRCVAEIISSIIRGSKHWEYEKVDRLWSTLVPILETATVNMCLETQTDWTVCISMATQSRDPNRCHWLLEYLLADPLKDPTSFVTCTRLHLLSMAVGQQSWRNLEISERLLTYLRPHLSHRFQNIREKISSLLVITLGEDTILPLGNAMESRKTLKFLKEVFPKLNSLYSSCLEKLDKAESENGTEESEEKESNIRLFKVVVKFIMMNMTRVNYSARPEYFELLPLSALLQNNEADEELAKLATNFLVILAQTMTLSKYIPSAIEAIKRIVTCPSWSARAVIAEFLPVFVFFNMATINAEKQWVLQIQSLVLQLLEDSKHEVRVEAAKVLSGLLHCHFIPEPDQLLASFKKMARKKLKTETGAGVTNNIHTKHAGVLGLCAFIDAYPYDVPDFLPGIFEQLRPRLSDPQPIPATIRKTLGDFKRTHHSNWEVHKLKFTEEELYVLSDLTVPPSYYV